jgi:tRNA-dihydrouridine synthase A
LGDTAPVLSRREIVAAFTPYVQAELAAGTHLRHMTRHVLGLFQGLPGARAWRRTLTEGAVKPGAGIEVIEAALRSLPDASLDARPGEDADGERLRA